MKKLPAEEITLWLKYMIELGVREIDIVHCFVKHEIEAHKTLILIELLIRNKEVIRGKDKKLHLTDKLPPIPKHIVRMTKECIKEKSGQL